MYYSWVSRLRAKWKGLAKRHTFSPSNFANAVYVDHILSVLKLFLSPGQCSKIGALLTLMCIYAAHTYWNLKVRESGPRLDAEATMVMVSLLIIAQCTQKLMQKLEFSESQFLPATTRLVL